jgi:hypothetical protein
MGLDEDGKVIKVNSNGIKTGIRGVAAMTWDHVDCSWSLWLSSMYVRKIIRNSVHGQTYGLLKCSELE